MTIICEWCGEKQAFWKEKGKGNVVKYCGDCKEEGMIKGDSRMCEKDGCGRIAFFNFKGEPKGRFCSKHSDEDMIDVKNRKCEKIECRKQPNFNFEGETKGRFCYDHSEEGMVNIVSKKCEKIGCRKQPNFNFEGETKGRFCYDHSEEGMVNIVSKKCEKEGCRKRPSFNFEGEIRGKFCYDHSKEGMICIASRKCEKIGCRKQPSFNFGGELQSKFCYDHSEEGMVNVVSKKCEKEGCRKQPHFNFEGEVRGKFCFKHSKKGMINIIRKKCENDKCRKHPHFNFEEETKGRFCFKHSMKGMMCVTVKKCVFPECKTQAYIGFLFASPSRCDKHRLPNMFNARKLNPKCFHLKCSSPAYYSPPSQTYPTHCQKHAPSNFINLIEKPCKLCTLSYLIPDNQDFCDDCRDFQNPTIRHAKELRIKTILSSSKISILSHDQVPDNSCSKRKPDFIIDCTHFFIILEVDENQHKSYPCECEVGRMIQLHQDFGGTPLVFIRYNPDSYHDHLGKLTKGSNQNPKRERRLITLIAKLQRRTEVPPLSAYYLFYDGDDGVNRRLAMDYLENTVTEIAETMINSRDIDKKDD